MIEPINIKIAIASGKGGTGKTMVSTNLFYSLQQHNCSVTLVDCDAEEPNDILFFNQKVEKTTEVTQKIPVIDESKCTFCGRCKEYCNYNAIFLLPPAKIIKVIEELCHGCGACSVACEYSAITEKEVPLGIVSQFITSEKSKIIEARMKLGVFSPVAVIKEAIKEAGDAGIILFDSAPGTSCPYIQTVSTADFIVLVTEPTPFGLSDLKQSVETLKTMNKNCGVIINRAGLGDRSVYDYLQQNDIPLLMEIPFDKIFASIYSKGEIIAKSDEQFQQQLVLVFNSIFEKYGNSSNQR